MISLPATYLGDVELSPHLSLRGLEDWCAFNVGEARTIDGRHLWWTDQMQGGRPLRLDGTDNHFTVAQLGQIRALQALAQPVLLRHHRGEYLVVIAGIDGPSLWIDYADYADDDQIGATVNLIEVWHS